MKHERFKLENKIRKFKLPLELWPSCLSGLGAKSEPIPDDPLDEIPCLTPTIPELRHLQKKNSFT